MLPVRPHRLRQVRRSFPSAVFSSPPVLFARRMLENGHSHQRKYAGAFPMRGPNGRPLGDSGGRGTSDGFLDANVIRGAVVNWIPCRITNSSYGICSGGSFSHCTFGSGSRIRSAANNLPMTTGSKVVSPRGRPGIHRQVDRASREDEFRAYAELEGLPMEYAAPPALP